MTLFDARLSQVSFLVRWTGHSVAMRMSRNPFSRKSVRGELVEPRRSREPALPSTASGRTVSRKSVRGELVEPRRSREPGCPSTGSGRTVSRKSVRGELVDPRRSREPGCPLTGSGRTVSRKSVRPKPDSKPVRGGPPFPEPAECDRVVRRVQSSSKRDRTEACERIPSVTRRLTSSRQIVALMTSQAPEPVEANHAQLPPEALR